MGIIRLFMPTALAWVAVLALRVLSVAASESATPAAGRDPAVVAAKMDRLIEDRLASAKIPLSPQADDAEFLRRVTLDLTGRIPTAERAVAILNGRNQVPRVKLIDELLGQREYGQHFGTIWYHRMIKINNDNKRLIVGNRLLDWLAERFNRNQPWNSLVTSLVTASGEQDTNPETTFVLSHVTAGRPDPSKLTSATSRLFLGVRLECCECHNHPFTALQQSDFWGVAAFFTAARGIDRGNKTPRVSDILPREVQNHLSEPDSTPVGSIEIPDTGGKTVPVKFLLGNQPRIPPSDQLRMTLAEWMTSPANPWFTRAAVNRLWAHFFGRGLVTPIDDMRPESETSHPEVLELLTKEFIDSGFDQQHLIRCICLSKSYQRSSTVLPGNQADGTLYSHMPLKMMTADVLFDSLSTALGHAVAEQEYAAGRKKLRKDADTPREQFRKFFHAEADDDLGVVEEYTHGVPQALRLMNSSQMNDTAEVVSRLIKAGGKTESILEGLYVRVLSRKPILSETRRMKAYLAGFKDESQGYADVMWSLLNSSEFVCNH